MSSVPASRRPPAEAAPAPGEGRAWVLSLGLHLLWVPALAVLARDLPSPPESLPPYRLDIEFVTTPPPPSPPHAQPRAARRRAPDHTPAEATLSEPDLEALSASTVLPAAVLQHSITSPAAGLTAGGAPQAAPDSAEPARLATGSSQAGLARGAAPPALGQTGRTDSVATTGPADADGRAPGRTAPARLAAAAPGSGAALPARPTGSLASTATGAGESAATLPPARPASALTASRDGRLLPAPRSASAGETMAYPADTPLRAMAQAGPTALAHAPGQAASRARTETVPAAADAGPPHTIAAAQANWAATQLARSTSAQPQPRLATERAITTQAASEALLAAGRPARGMLRAEAAPLGRAAAVQPVQPAEASRAEASASDRRSPTAPDGLARVEAAALEPGPTGRPQGDGAFRAALTADGGSCFRYSAPLRRAGLEGRVLLHLEVNQAGRAVRVAVAESSGQPRLDTLALRQARDCARFLVLDRQDRPVAARLQLPIRYRLEAE